MPDSSVKEFYVIFVRDNTDYGINDFLDNGDGTIADISTGLMWQQDDSGIGMNWEGALGYAEGLTLADYNDWRLPDAKELQGIIDYTRSPDTTGSAAIDTLFSCTAIVDEGENANYPFYWAGTTHVKWSGLIGGSAVYVAFGEALGWMEQPPNSSNYVLLDVHGAGAQRSDPKTGDPNDYPYGHGPQGDVVRIYNYVRCVRDIKCGEPGYVSDMEGDINADCYVNMLDFAKLGQGWRTTYEMPDLALIAQNWLME